LSVGIVTCHFWCLQIIAGLLEQSLPIQEHLFVKKYLFLVISADRFPASRMAGCLIGSDPMVEDRSLNLPFCKKNRQPNRSRLAAGATQSGAHPFSGWRFPLLRNGFAA